MLMHVSLRYYYLGSLSKIVIDRIDWFVNKYGVSIPYVFFSGGKDSTAVLIGVSKSSVADRVIIVYLEVTGNTHPLNVRQAYNVVGKLFDNVYSAIVNNGYVLKKLVLYHVKHNYLPLFLHIRATDSCGRDFWGMVREWGCPMSHYNRLCFREFKDKWFRELPLIGGRRYNIVGIKASDSVARRRRWGKNMVNVFGNEVVLSPINDFTNDEVWLVLRENNISLPTYELYGDSLNCMFCPLRSLNKEKVIVKKLLENGYDLSYIRSSIEYAIKNASNMRHVSMKVCNRWINAIKEAYYGNYEYT